MLLSVLFFTSCVSSGKFKRVGRAYDARAASLGDSIQNQQDSILSLLFKLENARGGNQMLLATQDKLQDRMAAQEDELDKLRGNMSNTSSRLVGQLVTIKKEAADAIASRDSLKTNQAALVKKFAAGLDRAGVAMDTAFVSKLPTDGYRISISGGELRLSVQEDLLFTPRSVTRLSDKAEVVLRGVMDALQADPLLKLTVVGHTDNKPNPRKGTNNWEYASLRATRLAEELTSTYYLSANRVMAASNGEFSPLTSNATDEGRARNRRVDFVLRNNVGNLLRELDKL